MPQAPDQCCLRGHKSSKMPKKANSGTKNVEIAQNPQASYPNQC